MLQYEALNGEIYMKKINFYYNIKKLKEYIDYKKNISRYILSKLGISLFTLAVIVVCCLLFFSNSILVTLSVFCGFAVIEIPFQIKMLNDFKRDCSSNKISAEHLLEDLEFDVLKNKGLSRKDLKNSYDCVRSTSKKREILKGVNKVKTRKKVIDYCMLSKKEKIVILRQIIEQVKYDDFKYTNLNTYLLDEEDLYKERFVNYICPKTYRLNNKNPIVKKIIKNKK